MKILLTGVTGFIGGAIACELAKRGLFSSCVFLVRADDKAQGLQRLTQSLHKFFPLSEPPVAHADQVVCADLADAALLPASTWSGITHVIHCAALATFSNNPNIWPMNVDHPLALARAIHAQGQLKRWLQVGTAMSCGPGLTAPIAESWSVGLDAQKHLVPYTRSKIALELALKAIPDFPLVVARPSIVIGHSELGCAPSPSIFWVFRMAYTLERFTCAPHDRIDVIPADWCAMALVSLLLKAHLSHDLYHVSAGAAANQFTELDIAYAKASASPPVGTRYQQITLKQLRELVPLFGSRLGKVNRLLILRALTLYGTFVQLNYVFDNQRVLAEGITAAPAFSDYLGRCLESSQDMTIAEQMTYDFK